MSNMELQTPNEYRHMVIMNERESCDRIRDALEISGGARECFTIISNIIRGVNLNWDGLRRKSKSDSKLGVERRWLPLAHDLMEDLALWSTTDPLRIRSSTVQALTVEAWAGHRDEIVQLYLAKTPNEFYVHMSKLIKKSSEGYLGESLVSANELPIIFELMNKARATFPTVPPLDIDKDLLTYEHVSNHADEFKKVVDNFSKETVILTPKEENTMKPINVENRTFIDGVDSTNVSDEQIFGYIEALEAEAIRLSKVETISAKLDQRISALYKSARKLAKFVDKR